MPRLSVPCRRALLALTVTALFAPTVEAADKGRWINDGFGRSTRDGRNSSCVASGGDTHAFAHPDCEGATPAARSAPAEAPAPAAAGGAAAASPAAPAVIIVEDPKATAATSTTLPAGLPAATVRDTTGTPVRDGRARKCVLDGRGVGASGTDCDLAETTEVAAPAPAAAPPAAANAAAAPSTGASTSAAVPVATTGGTGTALAAIADGDDDDDGLAEADAGVPDDEGEEDTPWLADGDGPDDTPTASGDDAAPVYAGESLWGDAASAAPDTSVAAARESDTSPVVATAEPAPPPAPPVRRVLQVEKSALFDTNSAVLKTRSVPELDELVAILRDAASHGPVIVVGHTDRLGSDKLNQRLSERRANAVRDYLVSRGVDPTRVTAEGRGRLQPVTDPGACDRLKGKALRTCLAPDRRVEIEAQDIRMESAPAR